MTTATITDTRRPLGLALLERYLAADHPELAISRHALRRLCQAGRMPCHIMPPITGGQIRFMVSPKDAVRTLRNLKIS